mmetsp:Transcript_9039/g.8063  ORF Transcript_9039/g.8063 Transcript_9039/m.8063 type:complete len:677 (+) Transcript_9039:22-2052(+)
MDESESSIIEWLHTFTLPAERSITSLGDLSDGFILSNVLYQIAPGYFEVLDVNQADINNISTATVNITKIITLLDGYYRYMLKKYIDISYISPSAVALKNIDDILNLVEIIIGAAFMCNDSDMRAQFVNNIFTLDVNSQDYIKSLIESVMIRSKDIEEEEFDDNDSKKINNNRELELEEAIMRSDEAVRHLREENQRLVSHISDLEQSNSNLNVENSKLKIEIHDLESEKKGSGTIDKSANYVNLQIELDETKRELDIKLVELDNYKSEISLSSRRLEQANEMIARLSMESRQMSDELDITREKIKKLAKAEIQIEKYQNKLEEMNELKKQNKELSGKVDQYLDQINQLESSNRSIPTLQRMVEQYKDKAVELERQKFEADSALQMREHDITNLQAEISKLSKQRNQLEDEIGSLNVELSQYQDAAADTRVNLHNGLTSSASLSDDINTDSITSLKEKVKKYEYEINNLRALTRGPSDSIETNNADIAVLQSEVEDLKRIKKEREETILQLRKQLAEGQNELHKSNRALADAASSNASTNQLKDLEQKLAQSSNTIKLLEEKLKEKETTINKLEQEKSKLEFYARRTLQTFKDKYITSLQTRNTEKRVLEEKIWTLTEKLEGNQETTRREERLLLSAMYELGMKIMDRNINSQLLIQTDNQITPQVNNVQSNHVKK